MFDAANFVPAAPVTTTGNSAVVGPVQAENLQIGAVVSAVSGTSPSMTLSVQWSFDGVNFGAGESPVSFAAITAAKTSQVRCQTQAPYFRLTWTITGTTPSFTLAAYYSQA